MPYECQSSVGVRPLRDDEFGVSGHSNLYLCWRSATLDTRGNPSCDLFAGGEISRHQWIPNPIVDGYITPGCALHDLACAVRMAAELGGDTADLVRQLWKQTKKHQNAC